MNIEKVLNAISRIVEFYGDMEEIGSSDISIMAKLVMEEVGIENDDCWFDMIRAAIQRKL
jgi:hypothetical protein